jgi:prophage antirepressor-like protein
MDILKAFKLYDKEFPVNICGTEEDPLFQANQIGALLGLKNMSTSTLNLNSKEKVLRLTSTPGGPQNVTFLTELGLYRLVGQSKKEIARKFQEWIYNVIKELRLKGKYELKSEIEVERALAQSKCRLERHKTLVETMNYKRVVYFTKVKDIDDERFVMKLGFTNEIAERNRTLRTQFGHCLFLDVYEVNRNADFELFLKRHPDIKKYFYNEPIINDTKSSETYLITDDIYKNEINTIVKRNIKDYQGLDMEQNIRIRQFDLEQLKLDIEREKLNIIKELVKNKETHNIIPYIASLSSPQELAPETPKEEDPTQPPALEELPELQEKFKDAPQNKPRKNTRQRKIQKYDPNTFELLKTYDGLMDAIRQNPTYSKGPLKDAAENCRVYNGFRWHFIERDDADIAYELPPTYERPSSSPKMIAMLNKEKTEILKVFSSMGKAQKELNIKSKESINTSIKLNYCIQNKYYFKFFEDCEENLKNAYLQNNALPRFDYSASTKVQQIDPTNSQVIQTYNSIADVLKVFCMSREVLKRACEKDEARMGYKWRIVC